jgi:hypothetical protein
MADQKISALTSASTPLAGTEVLPIVQGAATVKVTVANLTAGRAISATQATISTGNVIMGTANQGIDFSVNTSAPGMTSEILNDYEQGTWTPTGNGVTYAGGTAGNYTKIGNVVICTFSIVFPTTVDTSAARIAGLPFASAVNSAATFGSYTSGYNGALYPANSHITLVNTTGTAFILNVDLSAKSFTGSVVYQV